MSLGCQAKLGESCESSGDCGSHTMTCMDSRCVTRVAPAGAKCLVDGPSENRRTCFKDLVCLDEVCVFWTAKLGERCLEQRPCGRDLGCLDGRCVPAEEVAKLHHDAKLADEQKMFEQSGVESRAAEADPAQPVKPPPTRAGAVRVVEIRARGYALAACRSDERLIGGGCEGEHLKANRPADFGKSDTLGARWVCKSKREGFAITAFALCAKVLR